MLFGIAFILGFRNTPIEAGLSCTFAASTCGRTLWICSYISVLGMTSCIVKSVCVSFYRQHESYGNVVLISASMKCFGTVVSFRPVA
ncbi:hypothetical protein AVEN_239307-1 [Araneus ventricosus]|uniref:Uncharacterized protein n=1 Tax=Araneus ventricosus TaxID=182803 RepID=A0A4Y2M763_ARAVE|nr:hypothetical protein AVEN_239307-1 [Araneus ventricosus]